MLIFFRGLWNAPYISGSYLVQRHVVKAIKDAYTASDLDPDMAFCRLLREKVAISLSRLWNMYKTVFLSPTLGNY